MLQKLLLLTDSKTRNLVICSYYQLMLSLPVRRKVVSQLNREHMGATPSTHLGAPHLFFIPKIFGAKNGKEATWKKHSV